VFLHHPFLESIKNWGLYVVHFQLSARRSQGGELDLVQWGKGSGLGRIFLMENRDDFPDRLWLPGDAVM
jgi:hypothetical protein